MMGLSDGEESLTIGSAVLINYRLVTDGQTDRQTSDDAYYAPNAKSVARKKHRGR